MLLRNEGDHVVEKSIGDWGQRSKEESEDRKVRMKKVHNRLRQKT